MAINNPSIAFTNKKVDPTLKDLLDIAKKDIFLNFNCHAIAQVHAFDATTQTVSASVMYVKTISQLQPDGSYQPVSVNYPPLIDVPVIILGGGDWTLTFPIAQGDTCLILFNDRDLDNWYQAGQVGPVASGRLHSFSDAIALIGPRSSQDPVASYDTARAVLANGQTMIGVGVSLIKIANATTTLNTLLQSLISAIKAIQVDAGTFNITGTPVTGKGTIDPSSQSALATVATDIAGLLE